MKNGIIFLAITALISCESKKQDKQIDKEINRGTIAITARDTTDVLNIYKLNIEEGNLNSIQTTWAADARWLNAFGKVFVGRDTIIAWLKNLYSMPGYAASKITRQDDPQINFIRPDVAVVHEYHEREGQIINDVVTPKRKINTTYILSKEKGTWLIRDKVTMDERERSNPIKNP
ncbi:MAG TPA: DUF4440 domain-containing protein [Chitinophagaceae bacterium]|nr:DUF4440 domain-containing protein [Chitinophagaceae bacterium]